MKEQAPHRTHSWRGHRLFYACAGWCGAGLSVGRMNPHICSRPVGSCQQQQQAVASRPYCLRSVGHVCRAILPPFVRGTEYRAERGYLGRVARAIYAQIGGRADCDGHKKNAKASGRFTPARRYLRASARPLKVTAANEQVRAQVSN